ncbi:DUF2336 domain-containing protein [Bosea sp. TND4EK4]|uniref:DUF2336 domain-containing protein n=1 Tax=Bosea sp. TND4EK4 TaxID=1907408 RepID=UPI000955500B|nr:DUF2336 domain-containing protein [Bosea sp. TND4EK4]SIQ05046.1 hypothetical protein SAMN05880592_101712 [Bosea sp. TND4EK4]
MPTPTAKELADLARRADGGGLDLSQVSLRVTADLLMSAPRPRREDLAAFADMAVAMIPAIDEGTAVILARKLAAWPHTTPMVLEALRARGGPVAVALLAHGAPLDTAEIERLAEAGPAEAALALARRRDLTATASTLLIERDIEAIDLAILGNPDAPLPRVASDLLIARARQRPVYRPALLARRDLSNLELAPLFVHADPERRQAIVDSLAAQEALHPAERRMPIGAGAFGEWLALAAEDRGAAFSMIADAIGGGHALAAAMLEDSSREVASLALIGAGLRAEDATRFLIRLGDEAAHSVERVFALVSLMRSIHPAVARRLVLSIAGEAPAPARRRGQHQPAMDPSGTPGRGGSRGESQPAMSEVIGKIVPARERR